MGPLAPDAIQLDCPIFAAGSQISLTLPLEIFNGLDLARKFMLLPDWCEAEVKRMNLSLFGDVVDKYFWLNLF